MNFAFRLSLILSLCLSHSLAAVRVEEVPEKGVQPEVVTDGKGIVHLVYLRGDAKASEVRYTFRKPGEAWQKSQTVNSRPGSAVAMGSIRGPQLAVGQGGSVHVLWNGTDSEKTGRSPLWYARRAANGEGFAPQQDLLGEATALDGGASLAGDAKGRVFIVWHGNASGAKPEESQRLIFLRVSTDDGSTFKEAEPVNPASPGICACCSLRVLLNAEGEPHIFVRSAATMEHRAMTLYARTGGRWDVREVEPWKIAACPMSSAALAVSGPRLLGAWETAGKIRAGWMDEADSKSAETIAPKAAKHPALALNSSGGVLVAWVEGSGWNRGGQACWQVLDKNLRTEGEQGRAEGVPPWGRVAIYAESGGDFVLLR